MQVGQVQLQPAKRAHSPPHLDINRGGEGDELKKMERKMYTQAHILVHVSVYIFLIGMNWVDMMSC